jgi:hypothetical protein
MSWRRFQTCSNRIVKYVKYVKLRVLLSLAKFGIAKVKLLELLKRRAKPRHFQSISIAFNGSVLFGCGKLWKMVRDEIWDVRFQWCDWFCCTDFNVQYENCLRPWLYPSELLTTMSHTEQVKSLDENSCHKSSQVISLGMESVFFLTAKASCQRLHL